MLRMGKDASHNISPDLLGLAYPIGKLKALPGNPRKGDDKVVANSYKKFGQQKPIVARKEDEGSETGIVIAGNTQLRAARALGWTHIAVTWVNDWDDNTAAAFALADNRTSDVGSYDEDKLMDMLETISDDDDLLLASGYDNYIDDLLSDPLDLSEDFMADKDDDRDYSGSTAPEAQQGSLTSSEDEAPAQRPAPRPVVQYQLIFSDEAQQQRWFAFMRWLRKQYPDEETASDRVDKYLDTVEGFED
jgi:hypothetical protein